MFKRLAAILLLAGAMTSIGFATEVTENFTGFTDQSSGNGNGIFNVSKSNSPVSGSLTFDPSGFAPAPVTPSGPAYLATYSGGFDSVSMTVSDVGGTATIDAAQAFLLLCSQCISPWSLTASSPQLAFVLQLNSLLPVTFSPGSSVFDLSGLIHDGSSLSVLMSDSSSSLGFVIADVAEAPEPAAIGLFLCAFAVAASLCRRRRSGILAAE